MPTGDVVATGELDAMRIGGLYDVSARFIGSAVSYVVVTLVLLCASAPLGLVVLIGVPVLVAGPSLIVRPLQGRSSPSARSPVVSSVWAPTRVAGLRVLRGMGASTASCGGMRRRVHRLTEPQAQQLALARLVLADPHTLVLDEATSLLDPRAARHLERSLAAVVEGRTVVAIAHRLMTAHDADRVCVVEYGRISESARTTSCLPPRGRMPRCGGRGATSPSRCAERRRESSSRLWKTGGGP